MNSFPASPARAGRLSALLALTLAVSAGTLAAQDEQAAPTPPDRIVLSNGDALTGTFLQILGGSVQFESPILGELSIPLDNVLDLQTNKAVTVVKKDDTTVERQIESIADGRIQFSNNEDLPLDDLASINPPPPVKWTVNALVGLNFADGNTERRGANAEANITRRSKFDRLTGDVSWAYAEQATGTPEPGGDGFSLTQRRITGGAQYDYFFNKKLFGLANVRATGDELANVELRFTTGLGAGYQWIENDNISFLTEAGLNFVSENFSDMTPDNDYVASRARYRVIWSVLDNVQLDHGTLFLNSLEDPDDVLINKRTNINVALSDTLYTQFAWELDYDNTPAAGQERIDQRFFVSLGYSF